MKSISKLKCLLTILAAVLLLTGCPQDIPEQNQDTLDVTELKQYLKIGFAEGDSEKSVTQNITLPSKGVEGVVITWESSNTKVITNAGIVNRPSYTEKDIEVTLTATLKKGTASDTKSFTLKVIKEDTPPDTSKEDVEAAKKALVIIFAEGEDETSVTENITLPVTAENGVELTWKSSAPEIISEKGIVTRPKSSAEKNAEVTLTATLKKGKTSDSITFKLTVLKKGDKEDVEEAAELLAITYAEGDKRTAVTKDITLPVKTGNDVTVTWESNQPELITNEGIVTRPSSSKYNKSVTLTATLTKGTEKTKKTFTLSVQKNELNDDIVSAKKALSIIFAEGDKETSVTKDITLPETGINEVKVTWKSNNITVITEKGIVYRPESSASDTTVTLTATLTKEGKTDTKSFTLTVLKKGIADDIKEAKQALEIYLAEGDSIESVKNNITLPVTGLKNVNIAWTSSTPEVIANDGTVIRPDSTTADASVTLTATLTKGSVTDTKTFTLKVLKNEPYEEVASAKNALEIIFAQDDSAAQVTKNLTLPSTGERNVIITWASDKPEYITENGTVTQPAFLSGNKTVILTATLTKGNACDTKEFTLTVKTVAPETYTVTFNTDGGTEVKPQTVQEGSKVTIPSAPSKAETIEYRYSFNGWYAGTELYNFNNPVLSNIELTAKWTATSKAVVTTDEYGTIRSVLDHSNGSIHKDTFTNGTVINTVLDKDGKVTESTATDKDNNPIYLSELRIPSNHVAGNNYETRIPLTDLFPGEQFVKGDVMHFEMTAVSLCNMRDIYIYVVVDAHPDNWHALNEDYLGIFKEQNIPGYTAVLSADYEFKYQMLSRDPSKVFLIIASEYPEGESREEGNHRDYENILFNLKTTLDKTNRSDPVTIRFSTQQGSCPSSVDMYPGQVIIEELENIPEGYFFDGWKNSQGIKVSNAPDTNLSLTADISRTKTYTWNTNSIEVPIEDLTNHPNATILVIDEKPASSTWMYRGIRLNGEGYGEDSRGAYFGTNEKVYFDDVTNIEGNCNLTNATYYYMYSVQEIINWANAYNVEYNKISFFDWSGNNIITVLLTYNTADFTIKPWKTSETDIVVPKVPCGYPVPNNSALYGLKLYTNAACTSSGLLQILSDDHTTLYQKIPEPVITSNGMLKVSFDADTDGAIVTVIRPTEDIGKDYNTLRVSESSTHVNYDTFNVLRNKELSETEESFVFPFIKNGSVYTFKIEYQASNGPWISDEVTVSSSITGSVDINNYFDFEDGELLNAKIICAEDSYKVKMNTDITNYFNISDFSDIHFNGAIIGGDVNWNDSSWISEFNIFFNDDYVTDGTNINFKDLLKGTHDIEEKLEEWQKTELYSKPTWFVNGELNFILPSLPDTTFRLAINTFPEYGKEASNYKYNATPAE